MCLCDLDCLIQAAFFVTRDSTECIDNLSPFLRFKILSVKVMTELHQELLPVSGLVNG